MSERQAKAARRRRTAAQRAPGNGRVDPGSKSAAEEVDTEEVDTEPEQGAYPGVIVMRVPTEVPGNETIQLAPINGMDALAIPILLEKAWQFSRQNLGLEDRSK